MYWLVIATMRPSASAPIRTSCTASRAWVLARKNSRRSSIHLTGRRSAIACSTGQHVLRIEAELHAEATAHIGCDDPNAPLIERQALRQLLPDQVRRLGGGMDLQRARACPPMGDDAARLHGERAHPVHTEAPLDDDLGGDHAILRIARAVHVARQQIRGQRLGMQNRRVVGERAQRVRHMWQRLVVDVDEVQRVLCNCAARRDHAHHRLALVDRLIGRQRVVGQQRRAGHRPQHRQRPARGPHVGTRQDVTDAGHGAGFAPRRSRQSLRGGKDSGPPPSQAGGRGARHR